MANGETTILTPATSKSESLRTTVPIGIVRQFKLKERDKLNWTMEVRKERLIVVVTPEKLNTGE